MAMDHGAHDGKTYRRTATYFFLWALDTSLSREPPQSGSHRYSPAQNGQGLRRQNICTLAKHIKTTLGLLGFLLDCLGLSDLDNTYQISE